MPQKQNPARSVLIRSSALRAPGLFSTLLTAQALAIDERPDGAWHAEWQPLRELLELALGAGALARDVASGLTVNRGRIASNLESTGGLVLAERLSLKLGDMIGKDELKKLVARAGEGEDLAKLLQANTELDAEEISRLLDPAGYTGLAGIFVDRLDEKPSPR